MSSTSIRGASAATITRASTAMRTCRRRGRDAGEPALAAIRARTAAQGADDTCVMLYTSGTTGRPKGVVLSNRNIIATAEASAGFDRLTATDSVLAYLPMAWVGDFIFSMGQAYVTGFCVSCPESAATMQADLREIGPTYFFAPPRFYEGLLTSVTIRMEDAGRLKRALFGHCMDLARRIGPALLDGRPVGGLDRLRYRIGDLLVYGPLKNTLGMSRVRLGYTAGEAIGPGDLPLLPRARHQPEAALRPDRGLRLHHPAADGEVQPDTVGLPSPGSRSASPRTARSSTAPRRLQEYYRTRAPPRPRTPTAGSIPATPASSSRRAT